MSAPTALLTANWEISFLKLNDRSGLSGQDYERQVFMFTAGCYGHVEVRHERLVKGHELGNPYGDCRDRRQWVGNRLLLESLYRGSRCKLVLMKSHKSVTITISPRPCSDSRYTTAAALELSWI